MQQHKTIESVLERGEKLNDLVDRSNALSAQSKMFYKTAKKVSGGFVCVAGTECGCAAKLVLCCDVECSRQAWSRICIARRHQDGARAGPNTYIPVDV